MSHLHQIEPPDIFDTQQASGKVIKSPLNLYVEITYPNGAMYWGSCKNGKPHGSGRMKYQNGDFYSGVGRKAKSVALATIIVQGRPLNTMENGKLINFTEWAFKSITMEQSTGAITSMAKRKALGFVNSRIVTTSKEGSRMTRLKALARTEKRLAQITRDIGKTDYWMASHETAKIVEGLSVMMPRLLTKRSMPFGQRARKLR